MQLLHIPRVNSVGNGYETWSVNVRKKILDTLNNYDIYEEKKDKNSLLPDHKFPEIRWDNDSKKENLISMNKEEIEDKFQLLNNQRNQQKREVCRNCFQNNKRGFPYGIKFYYSGDENWNNSIPAKGEKAKEGCYGCGWYDLSSWKKILNKKINSL